MLEYKFDTHYKFTAKELDNETSYTYFGARYYDSDLSVWLSLDPMSDEINWVSSYNYCQWNPIIMIDPNGLFDIETGTIEKGDNLTKITKQINEKFGTKLTISDIAKANNIEDANKIQVGNKIALPGQNVELNFDFKSLKFTDTTYGIDMPGLSWGATSEREGYQSSLFQSVADKGHILEGSYTVDPARTLSYSSTSTWDRFKGNIGLGTWPGGKDSCGEFRTWLTPMQETNTYGRSGFSIHGGTTAGSAGFIDITMNNNSFHSWLKSYGKHVKLNVKY
jgi:RHS repeat-associated protein